jgi:hypothetical protein
MKDADKQASARPGWRELLRRRLAVTATRVVSKSRRTISRPRHGASRRPSFQAAVSGFISVKEYIENFYGPISLD